eukprot:scaffold34829_cov152-Isochrysis_galbana.AAC.2
MGHSICSGLVAEGGALSSTRRTPSMRSATLTARSWSFCNSATASSRRGEKSMQQISSSSDKRPCWHHTRHRSSASDRWRSVLSSGEPLRSRRCPLPLTTAKPRRLASSYARCSSAFKRCGTLREPVPRRAAARPRASRSTSAIDGRMHAVVSSLFVAFVALSGSALFVAFTW